MASVWNRAPTVCAAAASSRMGCTTPVSLLRCDAHECDVAAEQVVQRGGLDVARTAGLHQIDGKAGGAQQRQVVKDRIVLDGRYDHAVTLAVALTSAFGKTEQCQLVCLGAAVGQDYLGWADAGAKAAGNLCDAPLLGAQRPCDRANAASWG